MNGRSSAIAALCVLAIHAGVTRASDSEINYCKDIAPIFFKNCAVCHHPGEVAPFSLLNYSDTISHAKTIARVTRERYMPPWKAEPGAGEFRDVRRLSDDEIALIRKWVDAGTPEGDPKLLPAAPVYADNWKLGTPDLVVTMPQPYTIPAEGKDIYQCFVVPIELPAERYLIGFEYRPGNRTVVHHAIVSKDTTGEALKKDAEDPDVGYRTHGTGTGLSAGYKSVLGVWTPGYVPGCLPDGVGLKVEKNSVIVIQNHYHSSGKVEKDQSSVGLYFAKSAPGQLAMYTTLFQKNIDIPPGAKHHLVSASQTAQGNGRVIAITPHMHLLGEELKVTATSPDGSSKPMIWIKNWDFNWQHQYQYAVPFRIVKGTRIDLEAWFDNSAENPRNPTNPPKRVHFGENTTDEMAGAIVLIASDNPLSRTVVKVDPKVLDAYAGEYALSPEIKLTIKNESGTLMAQVSGQAKVDLFPESETEFFSRVPDAQVKFSRNEKGVVEEVRVIVDGKSHLGRRISTAP